MSARQAVAEHTPGLPPPLLRWLDAVAAPMLVTQGDHTLLANSAMQRLLGFDAEALQAMPFDAWTSEATREAFREHALRALSSADDQPVLEVEAVTASGTVRYLEVTVRSLLSAGERFLLLTAQDLSDMRFVQQSLLEVGRVMHQIVENDPVPTYVIDVNHRVTHWNAACAQLTGEPAHRMIGSRHVWRAFFDAEQPTLADLVLDGTIAQRGPEVYGPKLRPSPVVPQAWEYEGYFAHFGGGRWLYVNAAPLLDMEGKTVGAIATLQDVSARRQTEDELRRHRNALEQMVAERTAELLETHHDLDAFLENAPVGILTTEEQRIVRHNRTFSQMFELQDGAEVGAFDERYFMSAEDLDALMSDAKPLLAAGECVSHEMKMRTMSGAQRWVQLIAYAAEPSSGCVRVWWLLQDRTAMWQAQQEQVLNYRRIQDTNERLAEAQSQLLQSEKMASIGQLAAGVAHEINNPIGFVSSNMSTMRRYMESMLQLIGLYECLDLSQLPEQLRAQIAQLQREADFEFIHEDLPELLKESDEGLGRVKKIVQDLKDFSRVDHSDWQEADLNAGLESTLNVVMNEVKYKAEVRREYGTLPPVRCLAAQLNQVFMNLIVNAAHAIEKRGVITLRSGCERRNVDGHDAPWAWIEVQDDGCGMSEEVKRRIFEPFYTTKPVGKGTGLGLSLSFSIVQRHGGQIEVDSTPGLGTRFRIWVPVAGPQVAAA
ncbi:PAS domain S-box protein [Roseateles sp. BYS180W]|uniref:histidine kinase n=1 Tax=Roseateles rivi TaxID=3299028 RepID=A0ABW7FT63_9BURK